MTKCPYVPPHEWNVDFPHLMLRAKAVKFSKGNVRFRDRLLTSTDTVGRLASIPIVTRVVNATNKSAAGRKLLEKALDVHPDAILPEYHTKTLRKLLGKHVDTAAAGEPAGPTRGRVALFTTCYVNYNEPGIGEDLAAILEHNNIPFTLVPGEQCCGMPKLDVLMFKQELPLMFPDDPEVIRVRDAIFDPFEYLMLRHKHGKLNTGFKQSLGKVAWHVACHLRVQNIGMKTRDLLQLIPDTSVEPIERCSGHDGTYAVKSEFHEISMKICRPVVKRVIKADADHYGSDCPMAGHQIENGLDNGKAPQHPLSLLRMAYGI
jgi:Fe-S oxidoreductase